MADYVEKSVKKGKYATKSEYFRHLIRQQSENELYKELKQSQKELRQGKGTLLRSLKDLR